MPKIKFLLILLNQDRLIVTLEKCIFYLKHDHRIKLTVF